MTVLEKTKDIGGRNGGFLKEAALLGCGEDRGVSQAVFEVVGGEGREREGWWHDLNGWVVLLSISSI